MKSNTKFWIGFIIVLFLALAYSSTKECSWSGCHSSRADGSNYCYYHKNYGYKSYSSNRYTTSEKHYGTTPKPSNNKASNTYSFSGNKQTTDHYNMKSYSSADDFADDWEDDFEDWEEAYDYFEDFN